MFRGTLAGNASRKTTVVMADAPGPIRTGRTETAIRTPMGPV